MQWDREQTLARHKGRSLVLQLTPLQDKDVVVVPRKDPMLDHEAGPLPHSTILPLVSIPVP